jgi:molybdopterin-guanine dinucleotide biosynthesis protein A
MPAPATSCIIVAGGQSRRMGHDKRQMRLWGTSGPTLLEHVVLLARSMCADCVVVLPDPEQWCHLSARLVADEYPGAGPLAALITGLEHVAQPYALALAGDLPTIEPRLIAALRAWPRPYQALVPIHDQPPGRPEPLLALYHRDCATILRPHVEAGLRTLHRALHVLDHQFVPPAFWRQHDPAGRSFLNLNTPADVHQITASPHRRTAGTALPPA